MKNIIFLQDFFIEHTLGGAELHDQVVLEYFIENQRLYDKCRTMELDINYVKKNKDKVWFISNFSALNNRIKAYLTKHCEYLIYEHDYKFINVRNPIGFNNFLAPERNKININFYRKAKKTICLSKMHREIFDKNLGFDNIVNINCSMWSDSDLELIQVLCETKKNDKYAVINNPNPLKKTKETVEFCKSKGVKYDLIASKNYQEFLKILSKYKGLIFRTGHPEPTPRVAIEAKMLNCDFISQKKLIGVAHEEYFSLSGKEMILEVRKMRDQALEKIIGWIDEV
jgi:hypothetical protein